MTTGPSEGEAGTVQAQERGGQGWGADVAGAEVQGVDMDEDSGKSRLKLGSGVGGFCMVSKVQGFIMSVI